MIVRQITPEEQPRTDELFCIAFELPPETTDPDLLPREDPHVHCWAAFEDGTDEMMSTLMVTDFQMNFDGHSCRMGGMGGAATLPQYRRKGGIRGCFEAILPWMYENGYDFSYLYPFSTAYYRKYGYECGVQVFSVSVNLQLLKPRETGCRFCLTEPRRPMTEAIRSVDRVLEQRCNGMIRHDDEFYDWTRKVNPAKTLEFTYVCFAPDGTPNAYTTFAKQDQPDGRNLVCSRFAFTDREGFNALMTLFRSLATDHMYVKFKLPYGTSLEYLFPEWAMGAVSAGVQNAGMVRVVRVESALRRAACRGTGDLTLEIRDAQIPENSGRWHIAFSDGTVTQVSRSDAPADAVLPINLFSALLFGVTDFANAREWFEGLEILNSDAPFDSLFYRKKLMLCDYF